MTEKRIAIYARVSTKRQDCENQLHKLDKYMQRACLQDAVVGRYTDHAVSGRKQGRPGLKALQDAVTRREVNTVLVVGLDRLARNLRHMVNLLHEWSELGVQVVSLREAIDTSTPMGRAMIQLSGIFAEMEAELTRERVIAGLELARSRGKHPGQRPLPNRKKHAMYEMILDGTPEAEICVRLDVGKGSVYRMRRKMREDGVLAA